MYGHVCETGGTREVLPPCPLQVVTFKDLLNRVLGSWRAVKPMSKSTVEGSTKTKENDAALDSAANFGRPNAAHDMCCRETDETSAH